MIILMTCIHAALLMTAHGTDASNGPWTVPRIIARALATSNQLRATAADGARDRALARQAGRWDNPDLTFTYGPMKQAAVTGRAVDATIRQAVPLFGQRRAARKVGEFEARARELDLLVETAALRWRVTTLAYRLAAVNEEFGHIAHRKASVSAVARFLETRPQASPLQIVERELLRNRLREIEEELIEISTARRTVWLELNIHLDLDEPVLPVVNWEATPAPPDRAAMLARARVGNPELRARETAVAGARAREDQARLMAWPEVRFGAGYNEQSADLPQTMVTGLIELSLPIVDRAADSREAAGAARRAESYRLEHARREFEARFDRAWSNFEQSRLRAALYPVNVLADGEREMKRGEDGWRRGLVPTAAFLELEHQMHARAVKYYAARVEVVAASGEVEALVGQAEGVRDVE